MTEIKNLIGPVFWGNLLRLVLPFVILIAVFLVLRAIFSGALRNHPAARVIVTIILLIMCILVAILIAPAALERVS